MRRARNPRTLGEQPDQGELDEERLQTAAKAWLQLRAVGMQLRPVGNSSIATPVHSLVQEIILEAERRIREGDPRCSRGTVVAVDQEALYFSCASGTLFLKWPCPVGKGST